MGSSGPVSNTSLWEQLLEELDRPDRTIHWVKVPSHVNVEGNNEVDRLADEGRQLHLGSPPNHIPPLTMAACHIESAQKTTPSRTTHNPS